MVYSFPFLPNLIKFKQILYSSNISRTFHTPFSSPPPRGEYPPPCASWSCPPGTQGGPSPLQAHPGGGGGEALQVGGGRERLSQPWQLQTTSVLPATHPLNHAPSQEQLISAGAATKMKKLKPTLTLRSPPPSGPPTPSSHTGSHTWAGGPKRD